MSSLFPNLKSLNLGYSTRCEVLDAYAASYITTSAISIQTHGRLRWLPLPHVENHNISICGQWEKLFIGRSNCLWILTGHRPFQGSIRLALGHSRIQRLRLHPLFIWIFNFRICRFVFRISIQYETAISVELIVRTVECNFCCLTARSESPE